MWRWKILFFCSLAQHPGIFVSASALWCGLRDGSLLLVEFRMFLFSLCADPLVFAYCSGSYLAGRNNRDRIIGIAKAESLVKYFPSFFAACKYGQAENFLGYAQFFLHEDGFIFPFPASLMEEASTVGLTRLLTLGGSHPVMSLIAVKWNAAID